ncbi:hypothetical protein CABS01_05608 [Colletotrichum abscissum]|uniref:uncharacterized protein n=1 Tax=Colletotrichum abscissum TaxID=1671311 RepID=UPI0027D49ECC|nr:uncharacterized protein CABS01_05608 [Colletotrichum abscissum]KAK1521103.1 hypothetical protein CABS01_05608 [Colletotrichum abscissum]
MRNGEETMLCIHPDPAMYGYKATWDDALPYSIRPKREEKQQQDTRLRENSDAKNQGHCRCQTEQGGDSRKCEAPRRNHGRNRPATATEMKKKKKKKGTQKTRAPGTSREGQREKTQTGISAPMLAFPETRHAASTSAGFRSSPLSLRRPPGIARLHFGDTRVCVLRTDARVIAAVLASSHAHSYGNTNGHG